jgi:hypothetical protein
MCCFGELDAWRASAGGGGRPTRVHRVAYAFRTHESAAALPIPMKPRANKTFTEVMKPPVLLPLVVALFAVACLPAGEVSGGSIAAARAPESDLRVWPADEELAALVLAVAPRIERATGLRVEISDDVATGVPMFWSTRGEGSGWWGLMHDGWGQDDFIVIDESTPVELQETVALHEILHALRAEHVDSGAGVMSPEIWDAFLLTVADLEEVCSVQECRRFEPEACVVL